QVEEGWWEGLLNGKTGMFPSNFTKEILSESDTASFDTPASHEELRSGRTIRRVQEVKAMEGTVDQTQGREKSSPRRSEESALATSSRISPSSSDHARWMWT
ncbi:unnamed protein product, partial [Tetraodon nigroviridis]